MKRTNFFIIAFLFLFSPSTFSQKSVYETIASQMPGNDLLSTLQLIKPDTNRFHYFLDSTAKLEGLLNQILVKKNPQRKVPFEKSFVLNLLAERLVVEGKNYYKLSIRKKRKRLHLVAPLLVHTKTNFGLISVHEFSIPLVHTKQAFFYEKIDPSGSFNLFIGSKKSRSNPDFTYKPVPLYTYKELEKILIKKIQKSGIFRELNLRRTVAVGYYFYLDPSTVQTDKTPQLRCFLLLGGKRFGK